MTESNPGLNMIFTRKSIRQYTQEDVSPELVETLLRAAMAAPNTINNRDWAFVVVRERELLDQIADNQNGNGNMLRQAPLAIIVCGDLELAHAKYRDFWIQDCSAATENILLAANALGLGAVWLGTYPVEAHYRGIQRLCGLPEHIVPLSVISIGHPAENPKVRYRFEPEKVHYNRW